MSVQIPISFPSEAEALRQQLRAERHWTADERLAAVVDTLAAVEALSQAGEVRAAQLQYQATLEEEWRRRMKEFIQAHVGSCSTS